MKTIQILRYTQLLLLISVAASAQVGQTTLTLEDKARQRTLITALWYPTAAVATPSAARDVVIADPVVTDAEPLQQRWPVVVLSHGTGGDRLSQAWLATALVRAGYLVVSINHWGNTWDNKIPSEFVRMWERPRDITFVLDQLLTHPRWARYLQPDKIAAAGFSLGGYTVITLAGGVMSLDRLEAYAATTAGQRETNIPEMPGLMQEFSKPIYTEEYNRVRHQLADKRIKAVVAMAPAVGQGFDANSLQAIRIPVAIVAAPADSIAPVATNAAWYHQGIRNSAYLTLPQETGHYIFLNTCSDFGKTVLPPFLCQDAATIDRTQLHQEVVQYIIAFLNKSL